jgi:UDP-N-acetyl-2-amino-2-deoxyglucuronate dehydrogenase
MQGSNYALIGIGYIAPRHMKAIKETGGNLLCALDKHDSVGIIDSYFPQCHFFTEFENFDRHIHKLQSRGTKIDYLVVCSPNYLHDAHVRYGIRNGMTVICEKPLVIQAHNLEFIKNLGGNVKTILQLRYHPVLVNLKVTKGHKVNLVYCTPRGRWYHESWKGDKSKSGGILMNIGVHLMDMLLWKFGKAKSWKVHIRTKMSIICEMEMEKASVLFKLSIQEGPIRSMSIDGENVDFNDGFTDLHTVCYKDILNGGGYGVDDVYETIHLINQINEYSSSDSRPR